MKVARSALPVPLALGEGRGEGNGHGEQRLSWSGVALVAMVVSEAVPRVTIDASQTLGGFLPPNHRRDRNPVDIERLTPKRHRFFDYDYDYDYDNA